MSRNYRDMRDLEKAKAIAKIYSAGWWSDETVLEQLRILRSEVLAPELGPVIDRLSAILSASRGSLAMNASDEVLANCIEDLRDFVIGSRGHA